MHFLADYGLFIVKLISIVIAILIVVAGISAIASKGKDKHKTRGKLIIDKINDRFKHYQQTITLAVDDKKAIKAQKKSQKQAQRQTAKQAPQPRLFVIHFNGDIKASAVDKLREEVSAVLLSATEDDQVLVCVESSGGMVNAYGLAASQLQRLKNAKIKLTIAVDKVAASGGYMMACVADHIIAAPFAIVGSIGVIAQLPNFHRFLKNKSIDFEQLTAGQYKRTLTVFGENTKQGREKMQQEIEETHQLFKSFISDHREVDIDKVATGEYWYGIKALELKLVDKLMTSDDFLLQHHNQNTHIYEIHYKIKKSLGKRLSQSANLLLLRLSRQEISSGGQDYL